MISPETDVLARHPQFFERSSLIFAGALNDDPRRIAPNASALRSWSCYFDYAENQQGKSAVDFGAEFQGQADLLVYYWGKNKAENQFQLWQLLAQAPVGQQMLVVGENRAGVRSVESLLSPYGEVAKIDSARRCGLYHFSLQKRPHFVLADFWKSYDDPRLNGLKVWSLPGVFSAGELDSGTALLLSTINAHLRGRVLDMGCGAGVIGAAVLQQNPNVALTCSDIHAMALASTARTLAENQMKGEVVASNVFSHIQGKFDVILSNPPFHDGVKTAYSASERLIEQTKWHLSQGGELRIVANAFLPYPDLLDRHFGRHQVLAKTGKFKVYSARS